MNDCRLENPYVDEPGCIMVNSIKVKECLMTVRVVSICVVYVLS